MIYLYLFGTCFHFIYVFMIIGKKTVVLMNVSSIFYTFWEEQELILFGPVFVISHSSVMQRTSAYTWLWVFHFLEFHFFI